MNTAARKTLQLKDLFGVADYVFQFVLAGVIVIVMALLVEIPIHLWQKNFNRYATYTVGAIVGAGLILLGIFRAFGLKAIEAKSSTLISGFLGDNSLLSAIVIAFLTAGLPIGAEIFQQIVRVKRTVFLSLSHY